MSRILACLRRKTHPILSLCHDKPIRPAYCRSDWLSTWIDFLSFQAALHRRKRLTSVDQKEEIETSKALLR